MAILPKLIHIFNAIKLVLIFFTDLEKTIIGFVWNHKRPCIAKVILCKYSGVEGNSLPDPKIYYKAVIIKTAWYWHKNRHEDQWNRVETPEINPKTYSQLIFDKGYQSIQWEKENLFSKWCWKNRVSICRKMTLGTSRWCNGYVTGLPRCQMKFESQTQKLKTHAGSVCLHAQNPEKGTEEKGL